MLTFDFIKPIPLQSAAQFRSFSALFARNTAAALNDAGKATHTRVREPIKRHPGADSLYNSIKLNRANPSMPEVMISTSSPKAVFREVDTRAHIIEPRSKKALAFKRRGKMIIVKRVHHPGTKGTHSWQHGSSKMRMILPRVIEAAGAASLEMKTYTKRYS